MHQASHNIVDQPEIQKSVDLSFFSALSPKLAPNASSSTPSGTYLRSNNLWQSRSQLLGVMGWEAYKRKQPNQYSVFILMLIP